MTHLTSEEFEDILRGLSDPRDHLAQCPTCSGKLAEMRAIQDRLRKAFGPVEPGPDFADRLRRRIQLSVRRADALERPAADRPARLRLRRFLGRWGMASVAALVMIGVGLAIFLSEPEVAVAARGELVKIHEDSLARCECDTEDETTCRGSDRGKLEAFLKSRVGFVPMFPDVRSKGALRGACVARFRGQAVGAYVLQRPGHPAVSVIVIDDPPDTLGFGHKFRHVDRRFWACSAKGCRLAAVRLGRYTYCAVGDVGRELLTAILAELVLQAGD